MGILVWYFKHIPIPYIEENLDPYFKQHHWRQIWLSHIMYGNVWKSISSELWSLVVDTLVVISLINQCHDQNMHLGSYLYNRTLQCLFSHKQNVSIRLQWKLSMNCQKCTNRESSYETLFQVREMKSNSMIVRDHVVFVFTENWW